jgi:hypothetical protein
MSSIGAAWQRIFIFRVQWLRSSLAGIYLTGNYHTQASVLSHVAYKGGRPSASGLTSLQAGDHLTPSYSNSMWTDGACPDGFPT